MFHNIFSKAHDVTKLPWKNDPNKFITVRYIRKREIVYLAVDDVNVGWAAIFEENPEVVGDLIRACPLHFPYDEPQNALGWVAENLVVIKDYDDGSGRFDCNLDVPRDSLPKNKTIGCDH